MLVDIDPCESAFRFISKVLVPAACRSRHTTSCTSRLSSTFDMDSFISMGVVSRLSRELFSSPCKRSWSAKSRSACSNVHECTSVQSLLVLWLRSYTLRLTLPFLLLHMCCNFQRVPCLCVVRLAAGAGAASVPPAPTCVLHPRLIASRGGFQSF